MGISSEKIKSEAAALIQANRLTHYTPSHLALRGASRINRST